MHIEATRIPDRQEVWLSPGNSVQTPTTSGVAQTLQITNESGREVASVQIDCSSWKEDVPTMPISIDSHDTYLKMKIFGGAPMLILNVTDKRNPATIKVQLNIVGQ